MTPVKTFQDPEPKTSLKGKLYIGCFFILLVVIKIAGSFITFPFVGHVSKAHNVLYSILITAPIWISAAIFILLTKKDLSALKK